METKITGLTPDNVDAIRKVFVLANDRDLLEGELPFVTTTATTATFNVTPEQAARIVNETIHQLPGRGHPKASLHAVLRKLTKQVKPLELDNDSPETV